MSISVNGIVVSGASGLPDGMFSIRPQPNDANFGGVSGGGLVFDGVTTTVSAIEKPNGKFKNWLENGEVVSTEQDYSFTVDKDRTLVASFEEYHFIEWQEATMPAFARWDSIAYGNGTFVAVPSYFGTDSSGISDIACYSTDGGKTWIETTMPKAESWQGIAFGNNTFAAISFHGECAYSTNNGKTWSLSTIPIESNSSIAFGNNIFVAVSLNYKGIAYSTDNCRTWKQATIPSTHRGHFRGVAYGNGIFITKDSSKENILYSTNGANWSIRTPNISLKNYMTPIYANGTFLITNWSGWIARSTDDGNTWEEVADLPDNLSDGKQDYWRVPAYGDGTFVIMCDATWKEYGKYAYSVDNGKTWVTSPLDIRYTVSIAYGDGVFVVGRWDEKSLYGKINEEKK